MLSMSPLMNDSDIIMLTYSFVRQEIKASKKWYPKSWSFKNIEAGPPCKVGRVDIYLTGFRAGDQYRKEVK